MNNGAIVITDGYFSTSTKEFSVGGKKIQREKLVEKLNATISNIGMQGEVTIKFTKNILIVDEINKIREYKGLIVKLIPSYEKSTNKIKDWKVLSFKNNVLVIQVEF